MQAPSPFPASVLRPPSLSARCTCKHWARSRFRTYIHRTAEVDAILATHGLVKVLHRTKLLWQLLVYERPATLPAGSLR